MKKLETIKDNQILNYFIKEELSNLVDDVFKEHNLVFADIFYYADLPAYVVYGNNDKKNGVILRFLLDGEPVNVIPSEKKETSKTYYDYFFDGFKSLGYKVLSIGVNICTDDFISRTNNDKNKRVFINKEKDFWKVMVDKQDGKKIYVSYPNLMVL